MQTRLWFLVLLMWTGMTAARLATGAAAAEPAATRSFVYVSLGGAEEIIIYRMDAATGALTPVGKAASGGAPGPLAVDATNRHIYAAVRSTGSVATFTLDAKTGLLTLAGTTPVVANPVYVRLDHTGRWLLTSYYSDDKAAVYPIGPDAVVGSAAAAVVETGRNPHSIMADPSNRFVYVPNTGADQVLQFSFDAKTGKLSPGEAPTKTVERTGPRHFYFHPTRPYVYFVNEKGSSVSAFAVERQTGKLAVLQTITTLPVGFSGSNTCAHIEITPSGDFLYASNRGHDSLAYYRIDQATGKLTALGQAPTEKTPRSFNIDPNGKFLFAAGQASGRLASYRINSKSGKLEPLSVYEVGKGPAWVLVVQTSGR